jgi:hypothetical protein
VGYHLGITSAHGTSELQEIETSDRRWLCLIEALSHIESVLGVNSVSAQFTLKKKIGRGELLVKWADADGAGDTPNIQELSRSQLVLVPPGFAPDDGLCLRPLLILQSAILAAWPTGRIQPHSGFAIEPSATSGWMCLVEAVEYIRIVENCDSLQALRQLKREIGDGMVRLKWEHSQGPSDHPNPKYLQSSELWLIGSGVAPDYVKKTFRPLLVDRRAVRNLWPPPSQVRIGSGRLQLNVANRQNQVRKPPASESQIGNVLRKIYADPKNNRPNVEQAWKLVVAALPNARKSMVMRILKEPEFAEQRRSPGNQPKG